MKIRISESETYERKFPEEVDVKGFDKVLEDMIEVKVWIERRKNQTVAKQEEVKKRPYHLTRRRKNRKANGLDRETSIKLMTVHYLHREPVKKQAEMDKIVKGINAKQFLKKVGYLKQKYNIKPKEVGLRRFPKPKEFRKIESLRI